MTALGLEDTDWKSRPAILPDYNFWWHPRSVTASWRG